MAIYKGKTYTIEYEYHPGLKQEAIVLFHPHPLYLGTMMNKVITTCSIAARQLEYSFLRFNYTGVGDSSGFFGFGEYEATQAMALMGGVLQEPVKYHIGFSFGCNVIQYLWEMQNPPTNAIWIGASINELLSSDTQLKQVQAMIHGSQDPLCSFKGAEQFAARHNIQFFPVAGADHFFNGQQIELREQVKALIL
jgi:alpha/beta superfamily hydrolase